MEPFNIKWLPELWLPSKARSPKMFPQHKDVHSALWVSVKPSLLSRTKLTG